MVVASPKYTKSTKMINDHLPIIDLSLEREEVSRQIVKASEECGFFKVINHGVDEATIAKLEQESLNFFHKLLSDKQKIGPPSPFGYGFKNIGLNGDMGEVEYLLINANNPLSNSISAYHPPKFSSALSNYIEAVTELACEILDLMAEGLWLSDTSAFSKMIRDVDNDSLLRLNHYPSLSLSKSDRDTSASPRIGFGEHSDPQILTVLRSNDVGGLQISVDDGLWVPVSADPAAFCVNVGDLLEAMTNGRFRSVRHRAIANNYKSRMSMAYFAAPSLRTQINSATLMNGSTVPKLYRSFTWAEYKKTTYSLRLGDTRLNLFSISEQ